MGTDPSGEVLPLLVGAASFGFKAYAAYETGSNIFDLVHRIREGAAIRGLLIEMVADAALNFVGGKLLDAGLDGVRVLARRFFDGQWHHVIPKFLGGRDKGRLFELRKEHRQRFHDILRGKLKGKGFDLYENIGRLAWDELLTTPALFI